MAFFGGRWRATISAALFSLLLVGTAKANPALVVDVDSGAVLYQSMATATWFPASLTKLMTTYVALSAVREGRITLDTPLMVSARAASMAPSKMGFRPGTLVTLDNALKMLMVKSPNDIAVTVAEGIGGSVEAFADQMNDYGARLGLHESHFANPNGLPNPNHVSSARDMAIIARALLREFPEEHDLFGIGELAFQGQLIRNHNNMLGRYPGVDGMKTGYTCSAGFNVVLSAERNGRRLITVVLGAPSVATRSERAATLFDKYFTESGTSLGQLASLPGGPPEPAPDLRSTICGRGRANAIAEAEAETEEPSSTSAPTLPFFPSKNGTFEVAGTAPATSGPNVMQMPRAAFVPVRVFIGPVDGWTGPIARARDVRPDATDVASAPTPAMSNLRSSAPLGATNAGPVEGAAPGPLALVGATPVPAQIATVRFGRKARPLSLAVHRTPRRSRVRQVDPKLAAGTTPSIITGTSTPASPSAPPKAAKSHVKAAAKTKVKPKPSAEKAAKAQ